MRREGKEIGRNYIFMWEKPWTVKEGFVMGAGLLITGELLQLSVGPVDWQAFAWPVNLIVLVVWIIGVSILYAMRKKVYAFRFLTTGAATVSALVYAVALTAFMGLIRQVGDTQPAADKIGFTKMLSFWPFVIIYLWIAVIVAQVALSQLHHFKWRSLPSLVSHIGLLSVLVAATLGSANIQKLTMTTKVGTPEWRAYDEKGKLHELPLAIQLNAFTIDEYPPKLMIIDSIGIPLPEKKPVTLLLDDTFKEGKLLGWNITLKQKLELAAPVMTKDTVYYVEWPSLGAVCAVLIEATSPDRRLVRQGWITCGSYYFPYQALALDDKNIVMPNRDPERFTSKVEIMTAKGAHIETTIEVNKPAKVEGWKIYQLSYNEQMGRWSDTSVFQLVTDPWQPVVYTGICLMLLGAVLLFITAQKRKRGKR